MNFNKAKRKLNIFGWTKASHKGAIMYFTKERPERPTYSLKKKKQCKFNKGVHVFETHEKDFMKRIYCTQNICKNCGKQKWEFKKNTPPNL